MATSFPQPGIMWADGSLRNGSAIDLTDYGSANNLLNDINFDKFEFESGELEVVKFEGREIDQMVDDRLNCTESVLLSPYFRSEAKKLRDQAR